jgi:hypothetical protein
MAHIFPPLSLKLIILLMKGEKEHGSNAHEGRSKKQKKDKEQKDSGAVSE